MLPLRRIALAVLFLLYLPVAWAGGADAFFDQTLSDFRAELDSAKEAGKGGVLLMFEAEGCPYCRKMRTTILNREDVQNYYRRHFLVFSVDILGAIAVTDFAGKETTEKQFAHSLRVVATPTFLFVAPDGSELARYTGATHDAAEFLRIGEFVVDGHFKNQTIDAYLDAAAKPSPKP
jgi:thioredoxin-related protein